MVRGLKEKNTREVNDMKCYFIEVQVCVPVVGDRSVIFGGHDDVSSVKDTPYYHLRFVSCLAPPCIIDDFNVAVRRASFLLATAAIGVKVDIYINNELFAGARIRRLRLLTLDEDNLEGTNNCLTVFGELRI